MYAVADQLPRLGKRELICLQSFTCNYVVSDRRGFLFLCVLGMGCIILSWHSPSLPYNYWGWRVHIKECFNAFEYIELQLGWEGSVFD